VGVRGQLFFTIKKLQIEEGDLMDHVEQFSKQKYYDTLAAQEYSRGYGHLNLSEPYSSVISERIHPRGYEQEPEPPDCKFFIMASSSSLTVVYP
jgi:hypothetical protein